MDFDNEVDVFGGKEKQFEMPDGNMVTVHNQIIRCPELMFRPVMDEKLEVKGLHELVHKTAMDCDGDVRKVSKCEGELHILDIFCRTYLGILSWREGQLCFHS